MKFDVSDKDYGLNLLTAFRKPRPTPAPRLIFDALPPLQTSFDAAARYVIPRVRDEKTGATVHLDQVARRYTRAVLTGGAGLGKTSALHFLAQGNRVTSLADYHPDALPHNFENSGRILFDGAEPAHAEYLARIAREFPLASIFTEAASGQARPEEFTPLALQPFNDRELFAAAAAWFPAPTERGHGGLKLANRAAEVFVAALKGHPGTRLLAIHPLNLFLLVQVYQPDSPLPARRAELFEAYLRAKLASEPDADFAARALEGIALSTWRGQRAKAEHLARGYGLLNERPSGRIEFAHELLHAFLAARALRRTPDPAPLLEHLGDETWRDVFLFYAGLGAPSTGSEPAPGALVQTLLERGQLELAAHALAEAANPPPDLQARIVEALLPRAWEQEDAEAVAALAALRSASATDTFAARLKDRDPTRRARAARILGQLQSDRAVEYLLPQLRDTNAEVRDEVVAALGQSKSDRVLEPLLVALRGDSRVGKVDLRLRVAAARALGEVGSERAVPALIVDLQVGEPEVRAAAVQALIRIRSEFARKPLQAIVESNQPADARAAADEALKSM